MIARPVVAAVVIAAMLRSAPGPASAGEPTSADADAHVARARELHTANRPAEALAELRAAHALDPRPELLFAMGQMEFNLDHFEEAIALYEAFLGTQPEPREAALAHQAIGAARARIAARAPPVDPAPRVARDRSADVPASAPRDRWHARLAITGGGLALIGVGLYAGARVRATDTSGAHGDVARRYEQAVDLRTGAIVCASVGAAFVVAGAIRWMGRDDHGLQISASADGAAVSFGGTL